MTGFSEDGSSRHGEAGSSDVIESEVGDSGMNKRAADVEMDRRAGSRQVRQVPQTFGLKAFTGFMEHFFASCSDRLAITVYSKKLTWHLLWLLPPYVICENLFPLLTYHSSHVRTFLHIHSSKQTSAATWPSS
jgi:hypothetical protein